MSKQTDIKEDELADVSSEDLALLSAVILVIGDLFGLFAVLKARSENKE
ncbi:hypothetical protein [Paenibacillus silvisoli]|nr:hypothetical protein [Paenibacillus silvisoli]